MSLLQQTKYFSDYRKEMILFFSTTNFSQTADKINIFTYTFAEGGEYEVDISFKNAEGKNVRSKFSVSVEGEEKKTVEKIEYNLPGLVVALLVGLVAGYILKGKQK